MKSILTAVLLTGLAGAASAQPPHPVPHHLRRPFPMQPIAPIQPNQMPPTMTQPLPSSPGFPNNPFGVASPSGGFQNPGSPPPQFNGQLPK